MFNPVMVSMIMLLSPCGSVFSVMIPIDEVNPLPSVVETSTNSE